MSEFSNAVKRLRPTQIVAGISFILGKLMFIPAGASLFIENRSFGHVAIGLYAGFIFLSIVLCLLDFYYFSKKNSEDKLTALSRVLKVPRKELEQKLIDNNFNL
jgi:hypothetical protein